MKSLLIPEKPILIYPSLAATVGLDESVMLSVFSDITAQLDPELSNGYHWYRIGLSKLTDQLPFWDGRDLQRIITNLREKGIIIVASAPLDQADQLKFAFNEKATTHTAVTNSPPADTPPRKIASPSSSDTSYFLSKNFIPPNWQPDNTTFEQLAQHNITRTFAMEQLPEFVTYWRERGEAHRSWGSKFIQHTLRAWRKFESRQHERNQETSMTNDWQPSNDALEVLIKHAEIPREFIEDAIPEFILYWQERGDKLKTWNSKFIQHVRIQWKKFQSSIEHNTDPKPIPIGWQPNDDVYDVLRLANIDITFANELVAEFVLYWKDSNQLHTSWNTRYLQHVKRQWANRHSANLSADQQLRSTREISLEEELTDRSWAS